MHYKYAIVFSSRNRAAQLDISIPSMLNKYLNYDLEIVFMDDGSSDNYMEILDKYITGDWKKRFRILDAPIKSNSYNTWQPWQNNYMVSNTDAEYLILQNAEVVHVDNIVDGLSRFCSEKNVVFANVMNCCHPFVNNDAYNCLIDTRKISWSHSNPIHSAMAFSQFDHIKYNSIEIKGCSFSTPAIRKISYNGKEFAYMVYTGLERPVPWFFCGMIKKDDWARLGGYDETPPQDVNFGHKMSKDGFGFYFTSDLAIHIEHERR